MLFYDWKKKRLDFVQKLDYATKPLGVAAEHAYAADRFAREIVGFLKVVGGALAAADRQPVGRVRITLLSRSSIRSLTLCTFVHILPCRPASRARATNDGL